MHTAWADNVKKIENLLNITTHFSTGYTPIELHYGKPIQDEITKIINFPNNEQMKHDYIIRSRKKTLRKTSQLKPKRKKYLKSS